MQKALQFYGNILSTNSDDEYSQRGQKPKGGTKPPQSEKPKPNPN